MRTINITGFSSVRHPGRGETGPWSSLVDMLAKPVVVDAKHKVPGWSAAVFVGNRRAKERVIKVSALVLDFDAGDATLDDLARLFKGTLGAVHTTFSHRPRHPRLRLILPLSRPVTAAEYDRLWQHAQQRCLPHVVRTAARDASRFWFLPAHPANGTFELRELKGKPLDVNMILAHGAGDHGTAEAHAVETRARGLGMCAPTCAVSCRPTSRSASTRPGSASSTTSARPRPRSTTPRSRPGSRPPRTPSRTARPRSTTPTPTATKLHTEGRRPPVTRSLDPSRSGHDARLALKLVREGATDEAIEKVLAKGAVRKNKPAYYISRTISWARGPHESNLVHARIVYVERQHLPARDGARPLTRLRLDLRAPDGKTIHADLVTPLHGRESARKVYAAVLPDIPATTWQSPEKSYNAFSKVLGRRLELALRGGRVVWMRAAVTEPADTCGVNHVAGASRTGSTRRAG